MRIFYSDCLPKWHTPKPMFPLVSHINMLFLQAKEKTSTCSEFYPLMSSIRIMFSISFSSLRPLPHHVVNIVSSTDSFLLVFISLQERKSLSDSVFLYQISNICPYYPRHFLEISSLYLITPQTQKYQYLIIIRSTQGLLLGLCTDVTLRDDQWVYVVPGTEQDLPAWQFVFRLLTYHSTDQAQQTQNINVDFL